MPDCPALNQNAAPCGHPTDDQSTQCVFHRPKGLPDRWNDAALTNRFIVAFEGLLEGTAEGAEPDMFGFEFPKDERAVGLLLRGLMRGAELGECLFPVPFFVLGKTFERPVRLSDARFGGEVDIRECLFLDEVHLQAAVVNGSVYLLRCDFRKPVDLIFARPTSLYMDGSKLHELRGHDLAIEETLVFENVVASRLIDLSGLQAKVAVFRRVRAPLRLHRAYLTEHLAVFQAEDSRARLLDLRQLGPEGRLTFANVNFEKAAFRDTNLEKARFVNASWPVRQSGLIGHRRVIREESLLRNDSTSSDFEAVAESYRQLVLNYEGKRDFTLADEFHIGEMEMQRRRRGVAAPRWIRQLWLRTNEFAIYDVLSRYGTSFGRASAWLAALMLAVAVIMMCVGFRPLHGREGSPLGRVVEYNLIPSTDHPVASTQEWLADALEALGLVASMLILQHHRYFAPIDGLSRLTQNLAVLPLVGQSALFLLALRRRFRR